MLHPQNQIDTEISNHIEYWTTMSDQWRDTPDVLLITICVNVLIYRSLVVVDDVDVDVDDDDDDEDEDEDEGEQQ